MLFAQIDEFWLGFLLIIDVPDECVVGRDHFASSDIAFRLLAHGFTSFILLSTILGIISEKELGLKWPICWASVIHITYPKRSRVMSSPVNYNNIQLHRVATAAGAELQLQDQDEADWYENNKRRYLSQNKFNNVSDLQDLDRLLVLEVMVYRWSKWLTQGFDYDMQMVESKRLKEDIGEYSKEIRLVKSSLGIDRSTREKDKGENLAEYIQNLLKRAKEFGYHRNEQYELAVTKIYELRSMVMTFDRCDEEERKELDLNEASILEWIRTNLISNWDDLESAFRKAQSMWIKEI